MPEIHGMQTGVSSHPAPGAVGSHHDLGLNHRLEVVRVMASPGPGVTFSSRSPAPNSPPACLTRSMRKASNRCRSTV